MLLFTACGGKKAGDAPEVKETPEAAEVPAPEAAAEEPREETPEKEEPPKEEFQQEQPEQEEPQAEAPQSDAPASGVSLAKRLCGRYTYHIGSGDLSEDEYYTMDVISFGDNLYAYCGQAIEEVEDSLECYSFWASEFIPDDPSDLRSFDADSATVTTLNFSIMSNAGKYWDAGSKGTITLNPEGILFGGDENDGSSVPGQDSGRLFLRDDRAEQAFCYLKDDSEEGDPDLQGYWVSDETKTPVYLCFKGSNLYIYRKDPSEEVFLAAGGCDFKDGAFNGTASTLGKGGMPDEWSGEYSVNGDSLTLSIESDALPSEFDGERVFRRINEEDVHVTAMDEVRQS